MKNACDRVSLPYLTLSLRNQLPIFLLCETSWTPSVRPRSTCNTRVSRGHPLPVQGIWAGSSCRSLNYGQQLPRIVSLPSRSRTGHFFSMGAAFSCEDRFRDTSLPHESPVMVRSRPCSSGSCTLVSLSP